jgi:hypothetical protein
MRDRGDLDEEFRPDQVGADAIPRRRILREIFAVDLVSTSGPATRPRKATIAWAPNLHNIIGRKAGSLPNYGYSGAMKDALIALVRLLARQAAREFAAKGPVPSDSKRSLPGDRR